MKFSANNLGSEFVQIDKIVILHLDSRRQMELSVSILSAMQFKSVT